MANPWHVNWLKEGVARWNKRRKRVSFAPDLSGLRFFDLLPPDFRESPKASRYFEKIDLSSANMVQADLSNLNFSRAKFNNANMSFTDLSMSNLQYADFTNTNLEGASFQRVYIESAIFNRSNLTKAIFRDIDGAGAIFVETNISEEQRKSVSRMNIHIFSTRSEYLEYESEKYPASYDYASEYTPGRESVTDDRTAKYRYDVFFGTNRQPIYERGALTDFGDLQGGGELAYGICEVIVPEGHQIGSLGSPMWKRLLNRRDDRLRVENLISLNRELFWDALREVGGKMKLTERPTVFVHGYNTTFQQGVLRAAQIGYDLGIGQGIGLFSWPSKGTFLGYNADEAACEASKYSLADFIEQFVTECSQGSINIISHSMGCRCVLGALEVLSNGRTNILKSVNQVIFAAADVDTSIMPHLAKHAVSNCSRTTSYVSDKDKALKVSGWLHSFPRVGIMPPPFIFKGMDTIHVNNLDLGDFSHGYISRSRTILGDIFNVLKFNNSPAERHGIEPVAFGTMQYWRMKD